MKVKQLIEFLKTQPQDLEVIYEKYSERCILEEKDIYIVTSCQPRRDGWVQNERPDMDKQQYLSFPGN